MKKLGFVVLAVWAVLLCSGASVWEGAAAVSLNGELPEGGFYAATKSFPRNTIVDVTNLETGKTIRVIVAAGLDSPGLLAILSKDAADSIGMMTRSIGRIRMTMPSDPVAFSRFTEDRESSGDPDFDPQAAIAAAPSQPAQDRTAQPETETAQPQPAQGEAGAAKGTENPAQPETIIPVYPEEKPPVPPMVSKEEEPDYLEPDYTEPAEADPGVFPLDEAPRAAVVPGDDSSIVDLPETYEPPRAKKWDDSIISEPAPELAWDKTGEAPAAAEPPSSPREAGPEVWEPVLIPPPGVAVTEEPRENLPPEARETPADSPAGLEPPGPSGAEEQRITLVPAEERPPESIPPVLPPEAEISPIPEASRDSQPGQERFVDPAYILNPVEPPAAALDPGAIIPPIPPAGELRDAGRQFSVPLVGSLEKGKYYLQLGAYNKVEAVESELSRIGQTYPLMVQAGGNQERPLYRILLGPVNLGESGALLQRFRGSGFKDAFIRNDG